MSNKKTAVEWLVDELLDGKFLMPSLIEHAEAMEKEQIKDAFEDGFKQGNYEVQAIEFYSRTYKKKDNEQ